MRNGNGMKIKAIVATLALVFFATACGRSEAASEAATAEQPVADNSATGEAGGDEHAGMDHAAHGDMDHAAHGDMDHAAHGDMDHAAHGDMAQAAADSQPTAGSQPTAVDPHAVHDHAAHEHGGMYHVLRTGQYDPADLVAQPGAAIGDLTQCPVSSEVFRVTEDAPFVDHEGQNVYFCCPRCIRTFQRSPEQHLNPGGTAED